MAICSEGNTYYTNIIQSLQTITKEQEEEFGKIMKMMKNYSNTTITLPHKGNLTIKDFDYNVDYKPPAKIKATLDRWL